MIIADNKFNVEDVVYYRRNTNEVLRATVILVTVKVPTKTRGTIFIDYVIVDGNKEYTARQNEVFSTPEEAFK